MGPSRITPPKPTIAAVEGHAVAGGLELAIWCDLRVVAEDAIFGVFCRRWGVPLIDGGTVRLPRLIGQSHALDMILTGRPVAADEALRMGLANRVVPSGQTLAAAVELAREIAAFPQTCMLADRAVDLRPGRAGPGGGAGRGGPRRAGGPAQRGERERRGQVRAGRRATRVLQPVDGSRTSHRLSWPQGRKSPLGRAGTGALVHPPRSSPGALLLSGPDGQDGGPGRDRFGRPT